jgi:hypothetical protein
MTKNIAFKDVNQGTALGTGTGTLPLARLLAQSPNAEAGRTYKIAH